MCAGMDEKKENRVPLLLPDSLLAALDAWRRMQPDIPARGEAIRRLMQMALRREMAA